MPSSRLRFKISMSLDGYVAGPRQSVDNPLGIGGMRLHEWVFPLTAWRAMQGLPGGEVNDSTKVVEESLANMCSCSPIMHASHSSSKAERASRS
jgi:hypothetical protein